MRRKEGQTGARKEGCQGREARMEGMGKLKEGRKSGQKEVARRTRSDGGERRRRKEGRKEGRKKLKEGRKDRRKEGRKEGMGGE